MAFVRLGSEYIKDGYTQVDNIFLLGYLPICDAIDVKIYLFGLILANMAEERDNQIEKMAISLQLSEERIMEGYNYWEKKGLVSISKTNPPAIKYLSVKHPLTPAVKFNTEKYAPFVEEAERLFPSKVFNQNEYNAFMELIETSRIELNAMLLIMQYCSDIKAGNATTPYILAVANNWIKEGLLTEKQVDAHIAELENNSETLRMIFKALGIKRNPELEDRQLYLHWSNQLNYNLDAVMVAARALKRKGGMEKLDKYIQELYRAKAFSAEEVAQYTKGKEDLYGLAINITKNLGTYYGDVEIIIETYITNWLNMGFESSALLKLAVLCFKSGYKNYENLDQMVNRFFKMGLLTESGIDGYINVQLAIDTKIKEIFDLCNYFGTISVKDRSNYKTWMEWDINEDIIKYVAVKYNDKPFPMQSINRTLSTLHAKGIKTLVEAEKELKNLNAGTQNTKDSFSQRQYTDEQIKSVLIDFEEWDK